MDYTSNTLSSNILGEWNRLTEAHYINEWDMSGAITSHIASGNSGYNESESYRPVQLTAGTIQPHEYL